jgi:hypothetical protein
MELDHKTVIYSDYLRVETQNTEHLADLEVNRRVL